MTEIKVRSRVLAKNDAIADRISGKLHRRGIWCINLIGSPGSGKTALLEAVFSRLGGETGCAVIEGDVKTDNDMRRIAALGVPAVQIETQGACHLNADMVERVLDELPLDETRLLVIENVGNLICPVPYRLGEDCRAVVISVAEGEDKPLKYPAAFANADVVVVTKTDLAPSVDVSPGGLRDNALSVNPNLAVFMTSAKTGDGIDSFAAFLMEKSDD